nr:hypothetical protein [Tanacetum cinerariifolium]
MSSNRGGEPAIITIKIFNHQSSKNVLLIEKAPIRFPKEAKIFSKNTTNSEASQAMIEEDTIPLNPAYNSLRLEDCPKNSGLGVAKNLKKPSQAPRGVSVGSNVGFKPAKEYKSVSKKDTSHTSDNKKICMEPTKENVKTSSTSTTPIVDKIRKLKKLIIDGKITLVDDDGKPLKILIIRVIMIVRMSDSYENDDYDEDPYDDDMYEGQGIPDKIQDTCDNLDIKVRGHRNI